MLWVIEHVSQSAQSCRRYVGTFISLIILTYMENLK